MLVIDICKDAIVLAAIAFAAIIVSQSMVAWNNLPEYVWHVKQ